MNKTDKKLTAPKRGRPETRVVKLDATPEKVARAIFSAPKKPDPSIRVKEKWPGLAMLNV